MKKILVAAVLSVCALSAHADYKHDQLNKAKGIFNCVAIRSALDTVNYSITGKAEYDEKEEALFNYAADLVKGIFPNSSAFDIADRYGSSVQLVRGLIDLTSEDQEKVGNDLVLLRKQFNCDSIEAFAQ